MISHSARTFVANKLIVKSLKMNLLNFFQWQLLQRWRLAVFFKAIMVRRISKAVSCSRKGLYCGEMGSQP